MSKGTELTKVEQDALRWRVLERFLDSNPEQHTIEIVDNEQPLREVIHLSRSLRVSVDGAVTIEDIAQVLTENVGVGTSGASSTTTDPLEYAQHLDEMGRSMRRGIYQVLSPLDATMLFGAAASLRIFVREREKQQQKARTLAAGVLADREIELLMLIAAGSSIRIPYALVADLKLSDYVVERLEDEAGVTYHAKRKQEHQR